VCSVLHLDHARVIISNVYVAMRYLQVYFFVVFLCFYNLLLKKSRVMYTIMIKSFIEIIRMFQNSIEV